MRHQELDAREKRWATQDAELKAKHAAARERHRRESSVSWNEYEATDLGQHIGEDVADMIFGRDVKIEALEARIEELSRELALAELKIENLSREGRIMGEQAWAREQGR